MSHALPCVCSPSLSRALHAHIHHPHLFMLSIIHTSVTPFPSCSCMAMHNHVIFISPYTQVSYPMQTCPFLHYLSLSTPSPQTHSNSSPLTLMRSLRTLTSSLLNSCLIPTAHISITLPPFITPTCYNPFHICRCNHHCLHIQSFHPCQLSNTYTPQISTSGGIIFCSGTQYKRFQLPRCGSSQTRYSSSRFSHLGLPGLQMERMRPIMLEKGLQWSPELAWLHHI